MIEIVPMLARQLFKCLNHRPILLRAQVRLSSVQIFVGKRSCAVPREDMTVLQVLKHHGYPMEYDCQKGVCKMCQLDVELEGEQAQILACQEKVVDGMRVLQDMVPDASVVRMHERLAKEKAQQEWRQRRRRATGTAKAAPRVVDKRTELQEVKDARAVMASSELGQAQKLVELRRLMESMKMDVIRFCRIEDWITRQRWGSEEKHADELLKYIANREVDAWVPDVESHAC